jgi:hypothetical protein
MIITRNNQGTTGLYELLKGSSNSWVFDETWTSLNEILEMIQKITIDPNINATNYPNPLELFERAKTDLLTQYHDHINEYLNLSAYRPGTEFYSVGKKAVYYGREWFARTVENTSQAVFNGITQQLTHMIDTAIPSTAGFTTKNITETLDDAADAIRNQLTIPFGYDMSLTRLHAGVSVWNETVRFAVDHYPNYLDPYEKTEWGNEEHWTLKLRNRCVLGPTGLPLLPPSPVTPWVVTMNVWVIDVEGEYTQFKILDTSDETIFNPMLGHEPQVYLREAKIISASNTTLGENTRVSFCFTTLALGLVPPWGMMLGDFQDNWFDDHTPGFDEDS